MLRLGGNTDRQRERVVAAFEKQKTTAEIAEILKTLYHGGNGLGSVSAWYAEDGIHLSHGKSVRYDRSAQVISWESAAERIGELLESGQFASNVELAEASGYERSLLATKFWNLYHDLSEDAREAGYLSCLSEIKGNGFPEETHRLTEQLSDPAFRQTLKEEYAAFWTAYQQDRDLLRFHYHRPKEIWENLKDLDLPRRTFSSDLSQVPTVQHFITEDEIDTAMTGGSSFAGGKGRIYAFFMENHTDNRKKFCARIATGDYDAIIMGHSQFERIPISRERQERLLYEQIDEITEGIAEVQASGGERFTVKQLERTRKSLEARLEKLQAEGRKDDVVTFEQLGVDRLFVDEAHNYKNLFLYTKMRNVAGLSTSDAQKSSDMFAKCRYMDEITGNRGVIFATGTPVSNSMTELYTMQRYLQYERLQELNMTHFDCWASRFGETVTALELAPEGYTLVGR